MSDLIIGTDEGAHRLGHGQPQARAEEGPPSVRFLANAHTSTFAITSEGALWERKSSAGWSLINEKAVAEDVWSFGLDSRLPERMYLGVSPALLYISDDSGKIWRSCDSIRQIPDYNTWTFPPPPI